ncbi:MAG: methyltransferase domain-containing protein [Eubacteriaceae bacterium]|jgi:SAM-dependent methyltransferase|nr:methyltransferase domain-containing protein [Eubacteriaceae bacterium]
MNRGQIANVYDKASIAVRICQKNGRIPASFGTVRLTQHLKLAAGEIAVDVGCGAGAETLEASLAVGPTGFAYGIDISPGMLEAAENRRNLSCIRNASFLLGTAERLPLQSGVADVLFTNAQLSLCEDMQRVIAEGARALKAGGRAVHADLVRAKELQEWEWGALHRTAGCVNGSSDPGVYLDSFRRAGFCNVRIALLAPYPYEALESMASARGVDELKKISRAKVEGALAAAVFTMQKA